VPFFVEVRRVAGRMGDRAELLDSNEIENQEFLPIRIEELTSVPAMVLLPFLHGKAKYITLFQLFRWFIYICHPIRHPANLGEIFLGAVSITGRNTIYLDLLRPKLPSSLALCVNPLMCVSNVPNLTII
jgi:hypothetical protein